MNKNLHFIYPSLTIVNKTLVAKEPSDTIIRYYLDQKKDKESDWLNFTQGLNLKGRDLRLAHFASSELFKANLRRAQLQGIWGKVDIINSINWDALFETVSNQMEGLKARDATLARIKRGKERCAKFNISSQVLTSNMAFEQFIAYRIKCTCLSEHVAQGILGQHKYDWFVKELQNQELSLTNEKFLEDVREYMSRTCPEIADKIWKQWYFDSDWSIPFVQQFSAKPPKISIKIETL